ncbi:MAG: glycosyltransferase family 2 protein [Vicinamibacterales bacterium]
MSAVSNGDLPRPVSSRDGRDAGTTDGCGGGGARATGERTEAEDAKAPDLTVVVPVMNEEAGIASFARDLLSAVDALGLRSEIIFVDDHSTDDTHSLLAELGVSVVRHPHNRGYGASLKTGIQRATGRFVCIIDADHELAPTDIVRLLPHAAEYDMVVGARVGEGARVFPWHQRIAKGIVCRLLRASFGQEILDLNSGLRVFPRELAEEYLPLLPDGYSFTSTITLAMLLDGRRLRYTPVSYAPRIGETKVRIFSYTVRFIGGYIRVLLRHRQRAKRA